MRKLSASILNERVPGYEHIPQDVLSHAHRKMEDLREADQDHHSDDEQYRSTSSTIHHHEVLQ